VKLELCLTTIALIAAAGRSTRATTAGTPKQYTTLSGRSMLRHSLEPFLRHRDIDRLLVVIHPDDAALYHSAVTDVASDLLAPVSGGATRQESVRLGLEALAGAAPDLVLIHDAARPFVSAAVISRVLAGLGEAPAVVAALPVIDTLKRAPAGYVTETIAREQLWRAQTPQGFDYRKICDAHRAAVAAGFSSATDDAAIAEWAGLAVMVVEGSESNRKLTTAEDLTMAQALSDRAAMPDIRTGQGFDVHRFAAGDHIWLCGVRIAHSHALEGHSDADVGLHALTDAVLGAIGDGDIGEHFKNTDLRWRNAASRFFLLDAAQRVANLGGRIANVDVTIIGEAPKIAPHRQAMRRAIGEILGIDTSRVGVKATTSEGLGFIGRREGIAALASATVMLPASFAQSF
jgi:2-C-methyl-D-erythritol 4-phosphate cytidylyltransferase/2-C-methyl-D-erythritol 2,4-cyclodiphosphate synthase